MFGMKKTGVNAYANVGLETGIVDASPLKLTLMLYEGAISGCIQAKQALQQQDMQKKAEVLNKTVSIIESGLRATLNKSVGGDIAWQLDELYRYMTLTLMQASLHKDAQRIEEIQHLLQELKCAWAELLEKGTQAQTAIPAVPVVKTAPAQRYGSMATWATSGA